MLEQAGPAGIHIEDQVNQPPAASSQRRAATRPWYVSRMIPCIIARTDG